MDEDLLLVHSDGKSDDKQSWKNGTNRNIIRNKVDEKSTDLNDEEFRDGEEEEYEIEEILNAKKGYFPDGRMGYFVKWKGFNSSENSWVDEHDAGNAKALIEEFW
ncbi:hypothetical protein C0993_000559 [Termitomyces sp. T159_Od127]|nr:hypothetical protein C0993_000559 [Termitomyces sp. T159_Od127]